MGVLDRLDTTAVYLVRFYWTDASAVPHYVILCTSGGKARADAYHQPKVMAVSDLVHDNSGPSRCLVTVQFAGPFQVLYRSAAPSTYSWKSTHDNWAALVQAYPAITTTAEVLIRLEVTDVMGTSEVKTMFTGAVRAVSHCDGFSITLEVEQTSTTELTMVPRTMLTRSTVPVAVKDLINRDAVGTAFPLSFGDTQPGWLVDPGDVWWRYKLGALGFNVPMHPTIKSNRQWVNAGSVKYWTELFPWTEKSATAGLALYGSTYPATYIKSGSENALVYKGWVDGSGTNRAGSDYDSNYFNPGANQLNAFVVRNRVRPWTFVPVVPEPVYDLDGNAAKAVDRDPMTYCTVVAGAEMSWELSGASAQGRIAINSTDAGNATGSVTGDPIDLEPESLAAAGTAPVGIKLCMMLIMPPSGTAPGAGTVKFAITFSDHTTLLACEANFTPPTSVSPYTLCQINVPYARKNKAMGTADSGWAGTRFQNWDFTQCGDSTTPAADRPLYAASIANQYGLPFRLYVKNNNASPIYIMGLALVVGCKLNSETRTFTKYTGKTPWLTGQLNNLGGSVRSMLESIQGSRNTADRDSRPVSTPILDPSPYARRRIDGGFKMEQIEPPRLSDVMISRPSYKDTVAGTYTQVSGGLLTDPIHFARYVMEEYCEGTSVDDSTFGDYTAAMNALQYWYGSGSVLTKWQMHYSVVSRQNAQSLIDSLCADCMDLRVTRLPGGHYAYTHWFPASGLPPYRFYGSSSADSILDVDRLVLADNGMPQLEVSSGDIGGVINDIEITYGTGLMHIAKCNADGSDDGTGAAWGWDDSGTLHIPYSIHTPDLLCYGSGERWGYRPVKRLSLPHVESRTVATMVGMYLLSRYYRPEISLRFAATAKLHDLYPGMVFRLDNDLSTRYGFTPPLWGDGITWDSIYWMVTSNEQQLVGPMPTQRISAVCLPLTIGEEWTTTINKTGTAYGSAFPAGRRGED